MGLEANALGHYPEIAATAYVHPTATVIGRVRVAAGAFVGPHAVIRADELGPEGTIEPVVIGEATNIQDGVVIHALGGTGVVLGPRTSIAHAAVIHGPCRIGARCFVGFHSVVFRATLGDGTLVMHQALVEGASLPADVVVPSMTAVRNDEEAAQLDRVTEEQREFAEKVIQANVRLVEAALRGGHAPPPHALRARRQQRA